MVGVSGGDPRSSGKDGVRKGEREGRTYNSGPEEEEGQNGVYDGWGIGGVSGRDSGEDGLSDSGR